ncbi:hypothetical protein, conserved [Eimeria maxima]|uniref:Uncharacterized protein n=1 Tax=Eimeria maxima TaxID=5804 RepID=U6M9F0_EIMMA|nr:hypothetical protein, conserved [Eimeria maxima]CDJ60641.1 hypothetical protein, conserved [Eimeria maxima]
MRESASTALATGLVAYTCGDQRLPPGNVAEWLRRCPAKALGSARVELMAYIGDNQPLAPGNVAEWLRRCPAKALGSARVGSNPAVVVFFYFHLPVI